jgi:resuscitation-promoting factor RpfB
MNRTALLLVTAALLIISGLLLLGLELHKTVILVIDRTAITVGTWSQTTGSLLASRQIHLKPSDRIAPAPGSKLREGETIQINRAYPVVILADGKIMTVTSAEKLAGNLLQEAGVRLFPGDILRVDGREFNASELLPGSKARTLQVRRVIPITLNTPGGLLQLHSTAATLGHALAEVGISLSAADQLEPHALTPLDTPLTAWYRPARTLTIQANGDTFRVETAASTVGEALAEAGLALQGLDYSLPQRKRHLCRRAAGLRSCASRKRSSYRKSLFHLKQNSRHLLSWKLTPRAS